MASRFLVPSSSDYEEEEEQYSEEVYQEEEEEGSETPVAVDDTFTSAGVYAVRKRKFLSTKAKHWQALNESIDAILSEFSTASIQQCTKALKKAKDTIEEHGYPAFFLKGILNIQEKFETMKSDKAYRRFDKELSMMVSEFEDVLEDYKRNPESFDDADVMSEEEDEMMYNLVSSDDDSAENWFIQSDAEEEDDKEADDKEKMEAKREKVQKRKKAKAVFVEEVITEETAHKEWAQMKANREHGKAPASPERILKLLSVVVNIKLKEDLQLEFIYAVGATPSNLPIPSTNWEKSIDFLKDKLAYAIHMYPVLARLDRDFWANSYDVKLLFTEEVQKLHSLLPSFLGLLQSFSKKLQEEKYYEIAVNINLLLIHHQFFRQIDLTPLAFSTLEMINKSESRTETDETLPNKIKIVLYLAMNLAYQDEPLNASKALALVPNLTEAVNDAWINILYNRALCCIGISAFKNGLYDLCYESLCYIFTEGRNILAITGQNPNVVPPWTIVDHRQIEFIAQISYILMDSTYIAHFQANPKVLPEHHRADHIISSKLSNGMWRAAYEMLDKELCPEQNMLEKHFKELSMCCFLLTANRAYDTITIASLAEKFELSKDDVLAIVTDMTNGKSPVLGNPIEFDGKLDSQGFVSFGAATVPNVLTSYERSIDQKIERLAEVNDRYRTIE